MAVAVALFATAYAATASAELTHRGNLFVRFDGGISPGALPRNTLAPIALRIEGKIRVRGGQHPPPLRRIRIAINRAGHLSTRGLSVCRQQQIELATSAEALASCGPALVGAGGIVAQIALPDQSASPLRGELLLFNSVVHSRPAILAHVYQTHPVPITRVIVLEIRRSAGTFGVVLTARFNSRQNKNVALKSIFLQLERRYVFRGRSHAYLSAACSAPPGFPGATFPFARASATFDDGRTLASTLVRSCRVKNGA